MAPAPAPMLCRRSAARRRCSPDPARLRRSRRWPICERAPVFTIDPLAIAEGRPVADEALGWAKPLLGEEPIAISATGPPDEVADIQRRLGRERAGALVEETLAAIARGLAASGVRRFVIAGGETAGAIVQALGVTGLRIGRQIDPGVPWTASLPASLREKPLALALKSGNFGAPDFFLRAFSVLSKVRQDERGKSS